MNHWKQLSYFYYLLLNLDFYYDLALVRVKIELAMNPLWLDCAQK